MMMRLLIIHIAGQYQSDHWQTKSGFLWVWPAIVPNYSGEARKDCYDDGDGDGVGDGDSDGPIREHVVYSFMPYSYIRATCSLIGSKVCFLNQEIISLWFWRSELQIWKASVIWWITWENNLSENNHEKSISLNLF